MGSDLCIYITVAQSLRLQLCLYLVRVSDSKPTGNDSTCPSDVILGRRGI